MMRIDSKIYRVIAIIGVSAVVLSACGGDDAAVLSGDDFTRVAASITRQEDRVTADQLARWVAEDTRDFVIVDVRPEIEFNSGHVDGALNLSLPQLVSDEGRQMVAGNDTVVVYSNGSENAAKAAVMLRLAGVQASFLLGGYNHWGRYILNPGEGGQVDEELLTYTERRALSCSFCATATTSGYNPPVQMVTAPPVATGQASSPLPVKAKKKTKAIVSEGC